MKSKNAITQRTLQELATAARGAASRSYSPYSKFPVGAAVLMSSGKIFGGTNIENASYGLCQCAERVAIATAVAAGAKQILAVCVYTPTPQPTAPCGSCRQVIHEFAPQARVISICDGSAVLDRPLPELLPNAFGPKNLDG